MHIEQDLKLTLTGDTRTNEHELALSLRGLTHFLSTATTAQTTITILLTNAPDTAAVSVQPPTIVAVTDLPALTVAAPPPVEQPTPTAEPTVAEPVTDGERTVLPFAEYDQLVRSEMKRLSKGGIMCGHARWDLQRDRRLPTLQAIVMRYGFKRAEDLANKLGYLAPERTKAKAVNA